MKAKRNQSIHRKGYRENSDIETRACRAHLFADTSKNATRSLSVMVPGALFAVGVDSLVPVAEGVVDFQVEVWAAAAGAGELLARSRADSVDPTGLEL